MGAVIVPESETATVSGMRRRSGGLRSAAMVLSDRAIRRPDRGGRIGIDPYDERSDAAVEPRRARRPLFRVFRNSRYPYIDVKSRAGGAHELVEVTGDEPFILHPGEFVLGSTLERVTLPTTSSPRLEGKSSLGRLGLSSTPRRLHRPGFDGHVTLELSNVANLPITIYPGHEDRPALLRADVEPAETPYGSALSDRSTRGSEGRRRAGTGRTSWTP
jgi:dCTP deaminase